MRERAGRVREMVRKEFLQLFRDPRMVRVIFIAPVVQLLVFGYAVNTDIRDTATGSAVWQRVMLAVRGWSGRATCPASMRRSST